MANDRQVIGVVGIDGAGKTSVIRRFVELSLVPAETAITMTCPRYHETPNAPMALLSEQLQAFSTASDALGSFELKMTALFMQMTLFGPVEGFFLDTFRPRFIMAEHHALVDTLAYGNFYTTMVKRSPDRQRFEQPLREQLEEVAPATYEAIEAWHLSQNRRLGRDISLWDLAPYFRELLAKPWPEVIAELSAIYQTRLPDVVLLLDLPVEVAMARLGQREGDQRELHEQSAILAQLRKNYQEVLAYLEQHHPEVSSFVIDTSGGASLDDTIREIIDKTGIGG